MKIECQSHYNFRNVSKFRWVTEFISLLYRFEQTLSIFPIVSKTILWLFMRTVHIYTLYYLLQSFSYSERILQNFRSENICISNNGKMIDRIYIHIITNKNRSYFYVWCLKNSFEHKIFSIINQIIYDYSTDIYTLLLFISLTKLEINFLYDRTLIQSTSHVFPGPTYRIRDVIRRHLFHFVSFGTQTSQVFLLSVWDTASTLFLTCFRFRLKCTFVRREYPKGCASLSTPRK